MLLRSYLVTLVAFAILDSIWIAFVAMPMFQRNLGDWLLPQPRLVPAIAFYLIYAGGLTLLAVDPSNSSSTLSSVAFKAGVLGLTAYVTYDLTVLAILQRYTTSLALTDIVWGTVASILAASIAFTVNAFFTTAS